MKIGIIGAENSHTAAIARTLNVDKQVKGFTVEMVWGETDEFAKKAAEAGQIPTIVKDPAEMMGRIDALIVDHRHAKHHLAAARPFVERGIPTFVDKPFCYRAAEGREFLAAARRAGAPLTSFSTMPQQRSFQRFTKALAGLGPLAAGVTFGPCDLESPYGGIFFYGVHQVELALVAFGYEVTAVQVVRGPNVTLGRLLYDSGLTVTMHLIKSGGKGFSVAAVGGNGYASQMLTSDKNSYLAGIRRFTRVFKTGEEPLTDAQMLKPVQVLEALEKSVASGAVEKVEN
jgi:predicted dehydrogenase